MSKKKPEQTQLTKDELKTLRKCAGCIYSEPQFCKGNSNEDSPRYCDNHSAMMAVWAKIRPSEAYMRWSPVT